MKHISIITAILLMGILVQVSAGTEAEKYTFYGKQAGEGTAQNVENTYIGRNAGAYVFNSNRNTFVGDYTGYEGEGSNNTFIGASVGVVNRGSENTFIGEGVAGFKNIGDENTFVGRNAGNHNTTGSFSTFIGSDAGFENTTGTANVFMGAYAGSTNTSGNGNTFIGEESGANNAFGENNTYVGLGSGANNNSSYNTFIGSQAGFNNVDGLGNVFIGVTAGFNELGDSRLYIDNTDTSSPLIYGEFDTNMVNINGRLGVNTKSPTEAVDVLGTDAAARFKLTSITNTGNQAAQYVQQRARSNSGNPAAVESGDVIGFFSFRGWDGTDWTGTKAGISVTATEDWSETENGNLITISHTPNGSDTLTAALQIKGHADVYIPNGNLYVKGTKMNVPDYVFKDDYRLMPLNELKVFVEKNNHLPGVTSADEVGKAGVVNLSGLQMTLLEKVEELTLYTLQQEESLVAKDAEMEAMQLELESKDKRIITMEARQEDQEEKIAKLEFILTNLALDTSHASKEKVSMK